MWKSKGLSDETINIGVRPRILFDGQCLKQVKVKFAYKNVMNSYIACEIDLWSYNSVLVLR